MEPTTITEKIFKIGNKTISIKSQENWNGDIDDILKIDYSNIVGELMTFPVICNRLGVLLAEMDDILRKEELNLEVAENELKKKRGIAELEAYKELKKGSITEAAINSPTKDQIQNRVRVNEEHQKEENAFISKKRELLEIQADRGQINSFYWSAKAKMDVLTKLTDKLKPSDFENEIIDGEINGILIKCSKKE